MTRAIRGIIGAALAALLLAPSAAQAATQVLNFDALTPGDKVLEQYAPAPDFLHFGQHYDGTQQPLDIVVRSAPGFANSPSNVLESFGNWCGKEFCNFETYGTNISASFDYPKRFVSLYVRAKAAPAGGSKNVTFTALDVYDNPTTQTKAVSNAAWTKFEIDAAPSSPGIVSFFIRDDAYDTADDIDDLSYDIPDPGQQPTPDFGIVRDDPFAADVGMVPGGTHDVPFKLTRFGYTGGVSLSATGLPTGVHVAFSPVKYTSTAKQGSFTATFSADNTAANQSGTVTVVAKPDDATLPSRTIQFKVFVQARFDIDVAPPEVFQAVQDGSQLSGYAPSQATRSAGYSGVTLITGKHTIVRGYATVVSGAPAGGVTDVHGVLYGSRDGQPLPGSPLSATGGKVTLPSAAAMSIADERGDLTKGFTFSLPPEWTSGNVTLKFQAFADPQDTLDLSGNPVPQAECDGCSDNNAFTVTGVPFNTAIPGYSISPVWMTYQRPAATAKQGYQLRCSLAPGDPVPGACAISGKCAEPICRVLPPSATMVRQFTASAPIAETNVHVLATNRMDISGLASAPYKATSSSDPSDVNGDGGDYKDDEGWEEVARWAVTRMLQSVGAADLFGLPQPNTFPSDPLVGSVMLGINDSISRGIEWAVGNVDFGSIEVTSSYPLAVIDTTRTADDIHELGHALGRPHASFGCGGNANGQVGEAWPTADGSFLPNEWGMDTEAAVAGLPAVQRLIPPSQGYDAMSYCAGKGLQWISVKGWNEEIGGLAANTFGRRSLRSATAPEHARTAAVKAKPAFEVRGFTAADGTTHLTSGDYQGIGLARPTPSAGYAISLVDAAGHKLASAAMEAGFAHADVAGAPKPVTFLVGDLPQDKARRAAGVQVTENGKVVAKLRRSKHAPTVRFGTVKVRKGRLQVALRASDKDRGTKLHLTLGYATDGRHFHQLYDGPARRRVSFAVSSLKAGKHARLRAIVGDGWNVTVRNSKAFKVAGKRAGTPRALLLYPVAGTRQVAGSSLYLSGSATDVDGTPLRGRALSWYAGRRLLGHGAAMATARLRPGRHVIRLVATDAHGRRSASSTHVTITR